MSQTNILKRAVITEKSTRENSGSKFVFEVSRTATKGQIKQVVEDTFSVTVTKINTIIVPGKARRFGKKRQSTSTPAWKKAIVHLREGDNIDIFDLKKSK